MSFTAGARQGWQRSQGVFPAESFDNRKFEQTEQISQTGHLPFTIHHLPFTFHHLPFATLSV